MNKLVCVYVFLLLNFLFIISGFSQNPFVIGYNQDLVPSFYWKNRNEKIGIDAEIIKELFRRSNLDYDVWFLPWKRLMHMVKFGEIASGCPGFKTEKRETFAIYLEMPLNYAVFSIFVRKGESFTFNELKDLHGKKIGINRGYSISPHINDPVHKGKIIIEETDSAENNLKKLIAKRIDAYVGNRDAVIFTSLKMGVSDKIVYLPNPIYDPRPVYLMISKYANIKNKTKTIQTLNKNLNKMWKDNTIKSIILKHVNHNLYLNK